MGTTIDMELQSLLLFDRWMGGHHSSCEALAEQLEPGDQERLNCRNLAEKNLSTQMELCL